MKLSHILILTRTSHINYDAKFNALLDIKAFEKDNGKYNGNLDVDIFQDSDDEN
jgi:hypothetical protein